MFNNKSFIIYAYYIPGTLLNIKNAGLNFAIVKQSWNQVYISPTYVLSGLLFSPVSLCITWRNNIYLQNDSKY